MKFLTGVLLFTSLAAWAGNGEGNGGGAIVCADGNGVITSAKLLDLWEFESKHPGSIERSEVDKSVQLQKAVERLAKYDLALAKKVEQVLKTLDSKKVPLNPTQGILAPPSDTSITALRTPRNCPLSGAALYDDSKDTLIIDEEVTSSMSQTDLAALDFHEALYKVQRQGLAKPNNSVSARNITGAIFSNFKTLPNYLGPYNGIENATYSCQSDAGDMVYIIPNGQEKYTIQVAAILGERVFDKTTFEVTAQNTVGGNMLMRLADGFNNWDRIAEKGDMGGRDLFPFVRASTQSNYGPSLKLILTARDVITHKKCMGRPSCYVWAWEAKSRIFNSSVTIMATTIDNKNIKRSQNLTCTAL